MLAIPCPNCGSKLSLEEKWLGKKVQCGNCKDTFYIANGIATENVAASPDGFSNLPYDPVPLYRQVRRRKSFLAYAVNISMHAAITGMSLYLGYRVVVSLRANPQEGIVHTEQQPKEALPVQPRPQPQRVRIVPSPPVVHIAPEPAPRPIPKKVLPFRDTPQCLALPPLEDKAAVILVPNMTNVEYVFSTSSDSLACVKRSLVWRGTQGEKPVVVAGLAVIDNSLKFIWGDKPPKKAVAAVWNSVVVLKSQGAEHGIALRVPVEVEPLSIDLTKSRQRVSGKCEYYPPAERIYFELIGIGKFPPNDITDQPPPILQRNDEIVLRFRGADKAKTTITLKKTGNIAVAKFDSQYMLPSGDIEPMSISKGNRKNRYLEGVLSEAISAQSEIGYLRSNLSSAQARLRVILPQNPRWNAQLAAAKDSAVRELRADISSLTAHLARAEQLIRDLPAIRAENREMDRIANVARQLHGTVGIEFRFYLIVGDREVDLVIGK